MSKPLMIAGAGGFGREVLGLLRAAVAAGLADYSFIGFADDQEPDPSLLGRLGAPWLGPVADAARAQPAAQYVVAIGDPNARRTVDARLRSAGLRAGTLVHPLAVVGADVKLAEGAIVCAGAILTTNICAGRHLHVDSNATIGHDVTAGDFVRLNPGATVSGNVVLGDDVTVGANACVLQGRSVGPRAVVGAGGVVVRDVPPGSVVKGVPAR